MTRRPGLGAVLAVTAMLATGCIGSGDDTLIADAPDAAADPGVCALPPQAAVAEVNPTDAELVSTLLFVDLTFDGCTVDDGYGFSFGVQVIDEGKELSELVTPGSSEPESVDLGDEAVRSTIEIDDRTLEVMYVVRFGEHVVTARNSTVGNSDESKQVSEEQTEEFLTQLGASVPDGYADQALTAEVGEGCLAPNDSSITELVGPVQIARGGTVDDVVRCAYLSESLGSVHFLRSPSNDPDASLSLRRERAEDIELAGGMPGFIDAFDSGADLTVKVAEDTVAHIRVVADEVTADAATTMAEKFLAGH